MYCPPQEYLRVLEEPLPRGKDEMINRLLVALQHFRNSSAFSNLVRLCVCMGVCVRVRAWMFSYLRVNHNILDHSQLLLCPFEEDEYLVLPDIPILSEPMPDAVIASTAEESPFVIKKRPRLVEPLSEPCMDSGEPPSTPRGTPPSGSPRLVHFSPDRILKRYGGSLKKSPSEPVRRAGPQRKLREIQLQFESLRFKHSKNYRTLLEACVPFLTESLSQFEGVTLGRVCVCVCLCVCATVSSVAVAFINCLRVWCQEDATELQTLIATRDRLAKQLDAMLTPA